MALHVFVETWPVVLYLFYEKNGHMLLVLFILIYFYLFIFIEMIIVNYIYMRDAWMSANKVTLLPPLPAWSMQMNLRILP